MYFAPTSSAGGAGYTAIELLPVTRLRWFALFVCLAAAAWALAVAVTDGFVIPAGPLVLSSRRWTPAAIAAAVAALVFVATTSREAWTDLARAGSGWGQVDPSVVVGALLAALLVALWARAQPLWLDEEMIAVNLRDRTMGDLVAGPLWLGQSAPVGWLAVQRGVVLAIGDGERALRLQPLLYGLGTILVAWGIGRRWMNRAGRVVLVLLAGAGPWLVYHAAEMKPYSGDAFWALALAALAVWTLEGASDGVVPSPSRARAWWIAAACGLWFANGAIFVAPACALLIVGAAWRGGGWPHAVRAGAPGLVWLASFGAVYALSLRHTQGSAYLQAYWAFAMPPAEASLAARATWIADRLRGLAEKPAGSSLGWIFWLAAVAGCIVARARVLALVTALLPISAIALVGLRVVPLFERLSLWIVPALYVGIALLVDRGAAMTPAIRRTAASRVVWLVVLIGGGVVAADVVVEGLRVVRAGLTARDNHQLDDRGAMAWLLSQRQPGDLIATTHLALPAVWWYGGVPLTAAADSGGAFDGTPILEIGHSLEAGDCARMPLAGALGDRRRVLVLLGFRFDDVPRDFDQRLLDELSRFGAILAMREFGPAGRALVVERAGDRGLGGSVSTEGCLVAKVARRW